MTYNCKMCGGKLNIKEGDSICTCDYCGTVNTVPKVNDLRLTNLFNRANYQRMHNDFDKASAIYETILDEDNTIAEAHWGLVLCKYGVEYVDDPKTLQKIPTCHRTQLTSILADTEYLMAIQYADTIAAGKYKEEAKKIAEIQKKILEISSKESPYDIFICYKETDDLGNRTEDSSIAQDICTYLTNEGYKVFFSRITLRAHGGTEYEPYIFAALHSAKIMLVVGTKVEYLEAPWVKNEWGRFIAMMKEDKSKLLLPCYKYISPDALPDAFINCEALDIATPSFMLDLIKSIKKNLHKEDTRADNRNIEIHQMGGNAITLQKRADLFLEDGNFASAEEYYDKSLDQDPENSECYWGLIKCRLKCTSDEELVRLGHPLSEMEEYRNIFRFATSGQKKKYMDIDQKISNKIKDALDSIFQKKRQDLEILYVSYKRLRQNYKEYSQMGEEMFKRLEFLNTSINDYLNQLSPLLKHPLNNLLEQKQKSASLINNYMSDRKLLTKKDIQNACEASQNLVSAARINAEQIQKISREHPLFKSVDNLIRRRQELLNEIDQLMKDTQKNVSMLSNMQQQVKKINEKYEVLSKEVMAGDYINYNKMMQVS